MAVRRLTVLAIVILMIVLCRLSSQGLVEVVDEVFDIFDADGEPEEGVGYSDGVTLLSCVIVIAHHRRMGYERFDAAEAWADVAQLQRVEEPLCSLEGAFNVK